MNLSHEEKVLIKDIFNVRVSKDQENSSSLKYCENFSKQIGTLGPNASLIKHSTYFDSLMMEILSAPETDIISYLESCLARCSNVVDKPWNQSQLAQSFIKLSQESIKNYLYLSQVEPLLYPDQLKIDPQSYKIENVGISVAMRLITHFQRRGLNMELFNVFYPKLDQQTGSDLGTSLLQVLVARQRFQTIVDSKSIFYISALQAFMQIPQLKAKFMKLEKTPFLPGEIGKIEGSALDRQSSLGFFLRLSILGHNASPYFYQQNQAVKRYLEKAMIDIGRDRFGKDRVKYYTDLQNQYYGKFTDIYKVFLKKQSQKAFLEWNYAVITGNLGRAKLGSRLQTARNQNLSHDGFMVNIYMCLLNMCKPLFNVENGKYSSINPEYFMHNDRMKICKYEKINKNQMPFQRKNVDFGTITEFFFLTFQLLFVGVIPTFDNFIEIRQAKQRLQKMKDKIPSNHPMKQKYDQQLSILRAKLVLYYLVLMEQNMINPTIKLFGLLLYILPNWLGIDYDELSDGKLKRKYKLTPLVTNLPEHLLDSIYKFHFGVYRFKQYYLSLVGETHIHQILKLTCLILSEQNIVSNPYTGANFVELIFYFLYQNKTGLMYQAFKTNGVCHRNLTYCLMKFYCDIAVTGSSHQFYSKFRYRQFVNRIFMALWLHQVYRQNLKSYFKTQVFERFLNMVLSDTTYCFDEANQKYEAYKQLQKKTETGKLTEEQQRNQQQITAQIESTLLMSASNIKLIKQLSKWSPQTFYSQAFLQYIVVLLNNILYTFIDPTKFVSNRQLVAKYKFEKDIVLSNVIHTYVNLDISQKFASHIVKDTRFYKKEVFVKALQRASNEHQTDVEALQKFEQLISKLQAPVDQEEDQQIYGEIPDKYLCSLMSTLMQDPVQLPSGYIVDRLYIHKHLLNDERDPFTRAPLKNGEWKQLKDLKNEISVWKKKRMEQLKGGNKQVKYGKIGQNKKQQEEQSLYGDSKVIKYDDQQS